MNKPLSPNNTSRSTEAILKARAAGKQAFDQGHTTADAALQLYSYATFPHPGQRKAFIGAFNHAKNEAEQKARAAKNHDAKLRAEQERQRELAGILPCPFCGSDGSLTIRHHKKQGILHYVICSNMQCAASRLASKGESTAVQRWNSRNIDIGRASVPASPDFIPSYNLCPSASSVDSNPVHPNPV